MATKISSLPDWGEAGRQEPCLGVERGPGWLFVKVAGVDGGSLEALVDSVWDTIREHGASRVVLELDRVGEVDQALGDAIAELGTRVRDAGGLIRICGLSDPQLSRLRSVAAAAAVPHFETRSAAVGGRSFGVGPCE